MIKSEKVDLVLVDDPELEGVVPAIADNPLGIVVTGEEDPRIVTPDRAGDATRLRVNRRFGPCARCGEERHTIAAYDVKVYSGHVCGPCILTGKATEDHTVMSPIMRPMVFVARALAGEEPYMSLLKAADEQRDNPDKAAAQAATLKAQKKAIEKQARRLGLVPPPRAPLNRREKRIAARQTRRRNAENVKKSKEAKRREKKHDAAQMDAFDDFTGGFE